MAQTHPHLCALSDGALSMSYGDLERASRELAERLSELVSGRSRVVAIHGHRNTGFVVSILAAVRAGVTFAVLDAAYPESRLRRMAATFQPGVVIGDEQATPGWRGFFAGLENAALLSVDSKGQVLSPPGLERSQSGSVDQQRAEPAYLLFTSGTTGTPKCIATRHGPLNHFVDWYCDTFHPDVSDRFSMLSGLGHDPVLRDIFVPLSTGARICIPIQSTVTDPKSLFEWTRATAITFLHATPQLLRLMVAGSSGQAIPSLRQVFSGGDSLRRSLADELAELAPRAALVNFYGTSETPQAVAYHVVKREETGDAIPIGTGIRDTQVLVLAEGNTLAGIGDVGQIGIRTRFLSDGYLGDPAGTSRAFLKSPFTADEGDRIYLTGDRGYYRDDGEVLLHGRTDDQVKIRGFRVELAEINRVMSEVAHVNEAIALAHRGANGENVLVAFVAAPSQLREQTKAALDAAFKSSLPPYMVPARILWMDHLPLLPNGKIDRECLRAQYAAQVVESQRAEARPDSPSATLARQWRYVLGIAEIDDSKSFSEMGGDSLSYIQASVAVEKVLGHLPADWDRIPFCRLAAQGRQAAAPRYYQVGSTILLRAIAIVLIVVGHLTSSSFGDTTSVLFVLCGWSFAKFQMRAVLTEQSPLPILRSSAKIIIPTLLATAYQNWSWGTLFKNWWAFLMVSNYFPIAESICAGFWFIDILVQSFAILAVLFSLRSARELYQRSPYWFSLVGLLATMAGGMAIHKVWNTQHLTNWVPHMKIWLVFMGMAFVSADTLKRKVPLIVLALFSAVIGHFSLFSLGGSLLVILVARVPLPRMVAPLINGIAASSLVIYVTHIPLHQLFERTPLGATPMLEAIAAIVIGAVAGLAWNRVFPELVRRLASKPLRVGQVVTE